VDTLLTVPTAPPVAAPDRALPAPPAREPPTDVAVADVDDEDDGGDDEATATDTPTSEHSSTAATTQRLLLVDNVRRTRPPTTGCSVAFEVGSSCITSGSSF
jgi:hypothetical protein